LIANCHQPCLYFHLPCISMILYHSYPRLASIWSISIVPCCSRSIASSSPSSTPLIKPSSSSRSCPAPVLVSFVRVLPLSFCIAMYIADPRINVDPIIDQTPGVCQTLVQRALTYMPCWLLAMISRNSVLLPKEIAVLTLVSANEDFSSFLTMMNPHILSIVS
jgi:hypothetical protein